MKTGSEKKQMIDIWDSHFHVWDISENTTSGHDAKQLFAPKDNPVSFALPHMNNVSDASQAAGSVLTAVSEGNLTPIEATRVMGLIDSYRRILELTEIENRLKVLEDEFAST